MKNNLEKQLLNEFRQFKNDDQALVVEVIGWLRDIENLSRADFMKFYHDMGYGCTLLALDEEVAS